MSNEKENSGKESTGNNSSLIGVDPLAWLSEEEKASVLNEKSETLARGDSGAGEQDSSSYSIKLNSSITIRDITELMEELNSIDPGKSELIFESDQVERVDAAAMQLLTGFYLFAMAEGKKVIWAKPSEALCSAVELLGMKDIINISPVTA